jgi:hypothetical protein
MKKEDVLSPAQSLSVIYFSYVALIHENAFERVKSRIKIMLLN